MPVAKEQLWFCTGCRCIHDLETPCDVPASPMVEYPVVLWRGRDTVVTAQVRVPIDLKLAEVEIIARVLRAVAAGGEDRG